MAKPRLPDGQTDPLPDKGAEFVDLLLGDGYKEGERMREERPTDAQAIRTAVKDSLRGMN